MEFVGANSFARNCLNVRMNSHPHLLLFLGSGLGYYTRQHGIARHSFVSIPFHSGLGYYINQSGNESFVKKSQSLFIQGWGTTQGMRVTTSRTLGLNPFSFRAGVLHLLLLGHTGTGKSQSLFIQGWGTTPTAACTTASWTSLNPFSFRAGVLQP